MKINLYTYKFLCAVLVAAGIVFYISSCTKNSATTTPASDAVTEADAAQFTSDAVSPSSGGLANQMSNSTIIYSSVALSCGVQKDSTYVLSSISGAVPSYNYAFNWNYTLNCTGSVANNVTFNFTGKGSYNGALMSASDTSNAQLVLTGSTSSYLLTGSYSRTGTVISKIGRQYIFHSILNIQWSNVTIDKTNHEIASGTAKVTLVTASTSGKVFNFGGTLTFLSNKKATLVLNSGVTYNIQWL